MLPVALANGDLVSDMIVATGFLRSLKEATEPDGDQEPTKSAVGKRARASARKAQQVTEGTVPAAAAAAATTPKDKAEKGKYALLNLLLEDLSPSPERQALVGNDDTTVHKSTLAHSPPSTTVLAPGDRDRKKQKRKRKSCKL